VHVFRKAVTAGQTNNKPEEKAERKRPEHPNRNGNIHTSAFHSLEHGALRKVAVIFAQPGTRAIVFESSFW
jgi:hypothetical protein